MYNPDLEISEQYSVPFSILIDAYNQMANGKGNIRHNPEKLHFDKQDMITLGRMFGINGPAFQACKKIRESFNKPTVYLAREELLGAIIYIVGMIRLLDLGVTLGLGSLQIEGD